LINLRRLLALDEQSERPERRDRHQLIGHQVGGYQRLRSQLRLCILERFDVHEENRPSFLPKPELLDLALWLIRKSSPELATVVSRYMLADIRSSQAPYIIPNHLAQADPLILRFERWAREHLKSGFSLQEAAKALATSARTLQRRCHEVLGKSPLS
jgi:AraC-like DNA-binding protein